MKKHYGNIVEYTIRKAGYSISELSNELRVNRRSLYNWFKQEDLKSNIIYRIGCIIKHDFSVEFPEIFSSDDFKAVFSATRYTSSSVKPAIDNQDVWKQKYLMLLEQYNHLVSRHVKSTIVKHSVNLILGSTIIPMLLAQAS